jgi:hypothetical protein
VGHANYRYLQTRRTNEFPLPGPWDGTLSRLLNCHGTCSQVHLSCLVASGHGAVYTHLQPPVGARGHCITPLRGGGAPAGLMTQQHVNHLSGMSLWSWTWQTDSTLRSDRPACRPLPHLAALCPSLRSLALSLSILPAWIQLVQRCLQCAVHSYVFQLSCPTNSTSVALRPTTTRAPKWIGLACSPLTT